MALEFIGNIAGNFASGSGTMFLVLKMLLYGVMTGVGGWLAWYYLSFNIKTEVMLHTNGGYVSTWDKGRFKKDKNNPGVEEFQLLKNRNKWNQPLNKEYVSAERKLFGRIGFIVRFAEDEQGRFQPVKPLMKGQLLEWTGWNNNAMEFTTRKAKEYIDRFKKGDFMSKYGHVVYIGLFMLVFVMALVLFRQMNAIAEQLGAVASSMNNAATVIASSVDNSGVQVFN